MSVIWASGASADANSMNWTESVSYPTAGGLKWKNLLRAVCALCESIARAGRAGPRYCNTRKFDIRV